MDPAAVHAKICCSIHKISQNQSAIIKIGRHGLVCQNDEQLLCSVKRIKAFILSHKLCVHDRKLIPQFFIGNRNDDRGLSAHACGRIGSCFDNCLQFFFFNKLRLECTAASSCFQYF